MSDTKTRDRTAPTYQSDFYAWTQDQAARLREARPNSIDWENVAEEIESVGGSEKREIRSRLKVLLKHLLKWEFQPEKRKYGWRVTIDYQRDMIAAAVEVSPSLRRFPAEVLADSYRLAVYEAIDDTGLPPRAFPEMSPYSIVQALDRTFFPGPAEPDVR
ncbi:MAG TPA: DUF29 domain-containing protein [Bauldia sp.]|nr:DUF29 domain-containing protein [Bauldia sp.]